MGCIVKIFIYILPFIKITTVKDKDNRYMKYQIKKWLLFI